MKLTVLARYRARDVDYRPGEVIDLPDAEALALLADSPGSFAPYAPPPPAADRPAISEAPPADKMIRQAPKRKGRNAP